MTQQMTINKAQFELNLLKLEITYLARIVDERVCAACGITSFPSDRLKDEITEVYTAKVNRMNAIETAIADAMNSLQLVTIDI